MESSVITQVQKEDVQVSPKAGELIKPPAAAVLVPTARSPELAGFMCNNKTL